jgi:hypothetical protein
MNISAESLFLATEKDARPGRMDAEKEQHGIDVSRR